MTQKPSKVVFLGFDAFESSLLERWTAQGSLPNLERFIKSSARGQVNNPRVFGSGIVWTTLYSGLNLGRHGIYFLSGLKNGTYQHQNLRADDRGLRPFWDNLGAAGARAVVIDVPEAPLSSHPNVVHVQDWAPHDRLYNPGRSNPPGLIREIETHFGEDPVGACDLYRTTLKDKLRLRDRLIERIGRKSRMISERLERGDWDVFVAAFHEAHCIGHICWHLHDPADGQHYAEGAEDVGDPVKDVYVALDRAFGEILKGVDDRTNVIAFMGPGMGPNHSGNHLLDDVLRHLNRSKPALDRKIIARTKDTLKRPLRILPENVVRKIVKQGKKVERNRASKDWERRSCFAILPHNDISGAIRLNLVGREPNGIIEPENAESYMAQLTEDLLEVRNLDTGRPFIAKVHRTSDLCYGDRLDDLPDLYVEWNREAPINKVGSDKIGEIKRKHVAVRTGDHTANCFAAFMGPDICPGRMNEPLDLTDFAPTIAAMLGLADNHDYDGRVIDALAENLREPLEPDPATDPVPR